MPSLAAGLVAFVAGYILDALVGPVLGTGATLIVSMVGSTVIFYYVRSWFRELRGY